MPSFKGRELTTDIRKRTGRLTYKHGQTAGQLEKLKNKIESTNTKRSEMSDAAHTVEQGMAESQFMTFLRKPIYSLV